MIWKFLLIALVPVCFSLTIPNSGLGGYENLLIAINEKYVLADAAAEIAFLEKIKVFIKEASRSLFYSTKNTFYFRSVKILIPSTWQGTTVDYPYDRAVDESFAEADVRIFPFDNGYIAPFTQRSKYCGSQGEYIYLSPDYINSMDEQENPGKSFAQEWGIYRWGLFEEYGIQRDGTQPQSRFPYIETPSDNIEDWKTTGCSDAKIEGKYGFYDFDFNGNPVFQEYCDTSLVEIGYCRFVADKEQTAKSSLLYLPYLDSVTEFCDAGSHDKTSKNRYNYFCSERSAWEVIRSHPDYVGRTNATQYPSDPTFTIVKPKFGAPAIYVLVDTSSGNAGTAVFQSLKTRLSEWVSNDMRDTGALIGIGEFGGTEATAENGLPYRYIVNKLSPGPVSTISGDFSSALAGMTQTRPPGILLDKAVGDAAVLLTNRFWQQGSLIMLIKLTSGDTVSASLPEGPIIDLLTSRKSRLYSLEYSVSAVEQASLRRVALSSLGTPYAGGTNLNSFTESLNKMLEDIRTIAVSGFPDVNRIVEVGLNSFTIAPGKSYGSTFQMYINPSPWVDFQFYVSTGASVNINVYTNSTRIVPAKESDTSWDLNQWDLYSANISEVTQTKRDTWCYTVENLGSETVTVYTTAHHSRTKNPPGLGDPTDQKGDIHEFELWVTELNGEATVSNSPYRPFGIYAYFFNGLRAIKALEVYAIVTAPDGFATRLRLYDDQPKTGAKNYDVDLEDNDGIYSNIFAPTKQGVHHISVEAKSPRAPVCKVSREETDYLVNGIVEQEHSLGPRSLLPDQNDLYPPFGSIGAGSAYFQRYFPYFKSVNIKFTSYTNVPPRLLSLRVTPAPDEAQATISFFEPHLYDGARTPEGYTIRYSTDRSALIRSDGSLNVGSASLEAKPEHIINGDLDHIGSGVSKEVTFTVYGYSNEVQTVYFVMSTKLNGPPVRYGPPSPIVSAAVKTVEIVTTTTTTETTTVTTTTTQSTTTAGTTITTETTTSATTETTTTTLRPLPTVTIVVPTEEPSPCGANVISFSFLVILFSLITL